MFTLFNNSAPSWNLLFLAFIEVIVVGWMYGAERLLQNLDEMGMKINPILRMYWKICWKFITPIVLLLLVVVSWINFGHVKYEDYVYPTNIQILGYLITGCTLIWIPIFALVEVNNKGRSELYPLLHPTPEWGRCPAPSYGNIEGFIEERSGKEKEKCKDGEKENIPLKEETINP
jgi:hypothetical protein